MQDHIFQSSISPLVTISGHRAVTTSKAVADHFGKRHDHVLRDIKELIAELPVEHLPNFGETVIERENPSGGAPIKSPAYEITRDGFALLCMGFTGKKALAFKLAYIDAFNRMEAELRARPGPIASPAPVANEVERLRETLTLCEEGLRDCASTARITRQWLTQQAGVGLVAAPAVSALRMIESHAEAYMLGAEMALPARPAAAVSPSVPLGFLPPALVREPVQMELISDLPQGLAEAARVFLAAWRAGEVGLPYGPAELRDVQSAFLLWAGQRPGVLPEYLSKQDLERLLACGGAVARKQKVACPAPAGMGRSSNVQRVVFFPVGAESAPPAGVEKQDWLARWLMGFRAALSRVTAALRPDGRALVG